MTTRTTTVNGIPMRWEETGRREAPPVVLLHGIPTSPRLWRHVAPRIEGARVLAWEMVGYGASMEAGRGRDISVKRQAEYLAAWMDEISLERAIVAGHDLGGGVAQILAVRRPERVAGLVLTNAICYDSWPVPTVKALRTGGALVEQTPDELFRYAFQAFMRQGHDRRALAEEAFAEHWPFYSDAPERAAAAFIRQARALDVTDTLAIADEIPRLDVPARIVWGAADSFQKIGYGYRLAYDLQAPLDRIEGGKHFTPEDHPDRIAAAVGELLAEV